MTQHQDEGAALEPPAGFQPHHSRSPFTELSGPFFQRELPDGDFVRGFRVLDQYYNKVVGLLASISLD